MKKDLDLPNKAISNQTYFVQYRATLKNAAAVILVFHTIASCCHPLVIEVKGPDKERLIKSLSPTKTKNNE